MPIDDNNTKQVEAMEPGETRWISWGAILRLRVRDAQDQVQVVGDKVALSLTAYSAPEMQPAYQLQVTRNKEGYQVRLDSGDLDYLQNLRDADPRSYVVAERVPTLR